jgi:hypothetical protein
MLKMEENTYFQICALHHGGQDSHQETKTYKLTYKSKFGGFSYVSEFLEFDRTNENKAI